MGQRYVVLGAGAIGGAVGGLLFRSGVEVLLLARGAHLEALASSGLVLAAPTDSSCLPIPACEARDYVPADGDVLLSCTKSQDTASALAAIDIRERAVVCLQNGVANETLVARGGGHAYAAMVYMPASFLTPGRVTLHSAPCPGVVDVGAYPSGDDVMCQRLCADLRHAGIDSQVSATVMRLKYAKLVQNLGNVLQALGGDRALKALVEPVRAEAVAVLDRAGIDRASIAELHARGANVNDTPVEGRRREGGSSWQSLRRGKALETAFLNGEIVRIGARHRMPTPLNEGLVALAARASDEGWPPEHLGPDELAIALGVAQPTP